MKIHLEVEGKASLRDVWAAWSNPDDIQQWNTASSDWHTVRSSVDLREGGRFTSRMEAKDASMGFDFEGVYTRIVPQQLIEYRMSDGREAAVEFLERAGSTLVCTTFDAQAENPAEMQRAGWQAILDNFARYVEGKQRAA